MAECSRAVERLSGCGVGRAQHNVGLGYLIVVAEAVISFVFLLLLIDRLWVLDLSRVGILAALLAFSGA